MKISVCYIVKNEEKNLSLSLETVNDWADELIIVDTGSSDATKRIATDAGAEVFDFVWCDDFAAARNFAIDKATGDWIVFPDADEGFLHPELVRDKLKRIDAVEPPVDAVMVARINTDLKTGTELGNDQALRAFRRSPELRYKGHIHENINPVNGTELRLYWDGDELSLYHTGYIGDAGQEKAARNLRLLLKDAAENGEQPGQYMYLADCYFGIKDFQQALKYAVLALDAPIQPASSRVGLFHVAIESMRKLNWDMEEQLALADMALKEYPEQPEFYGEKGMILCGLGYLKEAQQSLDQAMDIFINKRTPPTAETYFTEKTAKIVRTRLNELRALLSVT